MPAKKHSKVFQALCQESLRQLVTETAGVENACLVSGDGVEISAVLGENVSPGRIAAMTSSMHALGAAITRELKMKECRSVIVDGDAGSIIMVRLPVAQPELVLAVTCGHRATVGGALFAARQHARYISEKLSETT